MRVKLGKFIVLGIVIAISIVFVFLSMNSGSSPFAGRVMGKVNGEPISYSEYSREMNFQLERYKEMMGGNITDEQLKGIRGFLGQQIFNQLVTSKLIVQESNKAGKMPSDEAVRDQIKMFPAFQDDGQFSHLMYQNYLSNSRSSASGFETKIRNDLAAQGWRNYFSQRAYVSKEEVYREYIINEEKRSLFYIVLTPEAVQKDVKVGIQEIKDYLSDESKKRLVMGQFESQKSTLYKDKKFEDVSHEIVKKNLSFEKTKEIQVLIEKLSKKVQKDLTAQKSSHKKVNKLLKKYNLTVQNFDMTQRKVNLPRVGNVKALTKDVFADVAVIDGTQGQKSKVYSVSDFSKSKVIAIVSKIHNADLTALKGEQYNNLLAQLRDQKANGLMGKWLQVLKDNSKIEKSLN